MTPLKFESRVLVFSGYLGADCKNLGLGPPPPPPGTSSGSPINGTKEHEAYTKGPIIRLIYINSRNLKYCIATH